MWVVDRDGYSDEEKRCDFRFWVDMRLDVEYVVGGMWGKEGSFMFRFCSVFLWVYCVYLIVV